MIKKRKKMQLWTSAPPWLFIGAVVVLFPIFAFMTIENINRQKNNSIRLLLEKGAALIRSFEAGTRTGMMGMHWKEFRLQKLLTETAQQPDIVYLLVTDRNGIILAHNDAAQIGKIHGSELDLRKVSVSETVSWRMVSKPDGGKIFEVFKKFSPTERHMRMHHQGGMMFGNRLFGRENIAPIPQIIFVGLDMVSIEEAIRADTQHSVIMGLILLLIGLAGITLLFLTHSYRSTRASLSRIKAFSDNLVENMPIGLLAIDSTERIASFNHVAGSILNLSSAKVIGKDVRETLPKELWKITAIQDLKRGVVEREIDCSLRHGKVIPLEVSATSLKDENGTFLGYVLLLKDLTEVHALKKEIARSQRLALVGRLAAGVAHEIRNPLSSIKGFATYFKERYGEKAEDQQISNIMIQEVDRINRVVGQLLDFARPITISKRSISLKAFIEDSMRLIEQQAKAKNIKIQTRISPDINEVFIDPDKISQVLLNLYLNALESMENKGHLQIFLSLDKEKKQIAIKISDTGCGISKDDLAHIFDPYFTTKASGTGLGLAIVHKIIESHGGKIKVESQFGQGTTVTLFLPYLKESKDI